MFCFFYDDVKQRQLIFQTWKLDEKVYNYQTQIEDPFFASLKFIFWSVDYHIINSTLEIKTGKNINMGFKIFNDCI
jgi:hypothetical protein